MSDSLSERAAEYEGRVGSADTLMKSLVRSVKRTRLALILTVIGLVLDLLLSVGLAVGLVKQQVQLEDQKATDRAIAANTDRVCKARNVAAKSQNDLVDALLAALAEGTGLPPAERQARMARYAATRVDLIKCD